MSNKPVIGTDSKDVAKLLKDAGFNVRDLRSFATSSVILPRITRHPFECFIGGRSKFK